MRSATDDPTSDTPILLTVVTQTGAQFLSSFLEGKLTDCLTTIAPQHYTVCALSPP